MNKKNFLMVLVGIAIVLLQYQLKFNGIVIDIFHDTVGFILIVVGVSGFCSTNSFFKKTRVYAIIGIVFSVLVQWFNTMDFSEHANEAAAVKTGLVAFCFIYVTYYFTEGIIDMARVSNNLAMTRNFRMGWLVFAGSYFLYFLALMSGVGYLAFIVMIVTYIAGMYHVLTLYKQAGPLFEE